MNLNSILIGSEDPARLVEYYTRILGEPSMTSDGYTGWQLGSGWLTIGPHDEVKGRNAHPGRIIWNIEAADVPAEFERMSKAGAIVVREPYGVEGDDGATSGWIATLADPDGNYFQLMSPWEGM